MAYDLPVYLFTGFLEGGKTHMIQESMESPQFNTGEKTLIIQCEEGMDELDISTFNGKNVYLETVENESDLTPDLLSAMAKKHKLDRILIEYNGMWMLSTLYDAMPQNWVIYQQMMFADANTFLSYNQNMRQLMVDKLKSCEMIVLNRARPDLDKQEVHKIVRGVSRRADIAYESPDGDVVYDDIEDPLPFDLEAPVVEIQDQDYAVWYRDISEETKKYGGKTLRFKGMVVCSPKLPKNTFLCGRYLMTCCEADIAYTGLACQWDKTDGLQSKSWVTVTATVAIKFSSVYGKRGPVLQVQSVEPAQPPAQEVATFY